MATIYLVRHGQASFGAANYDELSPLGQRQADATGRYFAQAGVNLDAAYSGDLARQVETCQRVLSFQAVSPRHHVDPRFNEIGNDEQIEQLAPVIAERDASFATLLESGLDSSKNYQKVIRAVFTHWVSHDCSYYGIQSWAEYSGQVRDALFEVMSNQGAGKNVGIFTSGGTIATIVADVLGLGGKETYAFYEPVFNCSVTQLFYSGKKVSLSYFNDRSFLQLIGSAAGEELVSYR